MSRLTARYDDIHNTVELYWGESLIETWPVPPQADLAKTKWRVDRFVAERLAEIFRAATSRYDT